MIVQGIMPTALNLNAFKNNEFKLAHAVLLRDSIVMVFFEEVLQRALASHGRLPEDHFLADEAILRELLRWRKAFRGKHTSSSAADPIDTMIEEFVGTT